MVSNTAPQYQELRFAAGEEHRVNVREAVLKLDPTLPIGSKEPIYFKSITATKLKNKALLISVLDNQNHVT